MSNRPAERHMHRYGATCECAASNCGVQGAAEAVIELIKAAPEDSPCKMDKWMGAHESRSRSLMPDWPSSVLYTGDTYS